MLVFLQKQMRNGRTDDIDFKVAALRVYLGLGGPGPLDRAFARKWMAAEWAVLYPGAPKPRLRADLDRHFAALLDQPVQPVALDATLIGDVRAQMQKTRWPRAPTPCCATAPAPPAAGLDGGGQGRGRRRTRLHPRVATPPLSAGIPGFYTRDGY